MLERVDMLTDLHVVRAAGKDKQPGSIRLSAPFDDCTIGCVIVAGFIDNDVKLPDVVCDSSVGKALTS